MSAETTFAHLPAELGPVLEGRGFRALTPIQEAVLDPALAGRDLRLSSQTGSGKTVAIGLALAREFGEEDSKATKNGKAQPRYLAIAPTRELATQVGDELRWLFKRQQMGIVCVTGGTNIALDFRALKSAPDVLVGTPGRLLDHVRRDSVDLSQCKAVVLDEADEMLDMGFREELEGILDATPSDRQTHMVSATFPKAVLSLAARYQDNAVLVEGENAREANQDIRHVVHDVRMGDRIDAMINILLAEPDERTLVFVRTRVSTAQVATELTAAGFKAFPLNGEMGQRERTSTLDAFRSGKVQLLVATDVAARGLDIREVTRIIHYDLPENPEAFTHRSGRTGRAGQKGTSILFVPPGGFRKVDYLTRGAKVSVETLPVPGVRDIQDAAEERVLASFAEDKTIANHGESLLRLAESILEKHAPEEVVAELLGRLNITGPCKPRHIQPPRSNYKAGGKRGNAGPQEKFARGKGPRDNSEEYEAFQVTWGAQQGADPRRLLALVCRRGGVKGHAIGAIRIGDRGSMVQVKKSEAQAFERAASRPDPRDPRIKIRPWLEPKLRGGGPPKEKGAKAAGGRPSKDKLPYAGSQKFRSGKKSKPGKGFGFHEARGPRKAKSYSQAQR